MNEYYNFLRGIVATNLSYQIVKYFITGNYRNFFKSLLAVVLH